MSAFASRNLYEHSARGVGAAVLVVITAGLLTSPDLLHEVAAAGAIIAAVVLLRGCPMCWFIGLIETLSTSARNGRHS